jgi:hypothetical protein
MVPESRPVNAINRDASASAEAQIDQTRLTKQQTAGVRARRAAPNVFGVAVGLDRSGTRSNPLGKSTLRSSGGNKNKSAIAGTFIG